MTSGSSSQGSKGDGCAKINFKKNLCKDKDKNNSEISEMFRKIWSATDPSLIVKDIIIKNNNKEILSINNDEENKRISSNMKIKKILIIFCNLSKKININSLFGSDFSIGSKAIIKFLDFCYEINNNELCIAGDAIATDVCGSVYGFLKICFNLSSGQSGEQDRQQSKGKQSKDSDIVGKLILLVESSNSGTGQTDQGKDTS